VCCITPASNNFEETQSTLGFALRAKSVCNRLKVNEIVDDATLIKRLQSEIALLKRKFRHSEAGVFQVDDSEDAAEVCTVNSLGAGRKRPKSLSLAGLTYESDDIVMESPSIVDEEERKRPVVSRLSVIVEQNEAEDAEITSNDFTCFHDSFPHCDCNRFVHARFKRG